MGKICYVQNHESEYSLCVVYRCIIINEMMVYRLKKWKLYYTMMRTQLCLSLHSFFYTYIHTFTVLFEEGNACSVQQMHTLWLWLWMPLLQPVWKTKNRPGASVLSFVRWAQRETVAAWTVGRTNINVIYSAYSFLTRSTSLFYHGLFLVLLIPLATHVTLSVCHCLSCSCFYSFVNVCVAQVAGQWTILTKMKHLIASLSLSFMLMAVELLYIQIA